MVFTLSRYPRHSGDAITKRWSAMRKPDSITYGTEDRLPVPVVLMLATQQVMVLSIFLVAPVLVAGVAKLLLDQATNFISVTTFALGVATLLQIRRSLASQCGRGSPVMMVAMSETIALAA
jgi:xanthine/uracil permease